MGAGVHWIRWRRKRAGVQVLVCHRHARLWFDANVAHLSLLHGKNDPNIIMGIYCEVIIAIFVFIQSPDKLILLPDGKLRHYIKHTEDDDDFQLKHLAQDEPPVFYDYNKGHYCMDKVNI